MKEQIRDGSHTEVKSHTFQASTQSSPLIFHWEKEEMWQIGLQAWTLGAKRKREKKADEERMASGDDLGATFLKKPWLLCILKTLHKESQDWSSQLPGLISVGGMIFLYTVKLCHSDWFNKKNWTANS